MYVLYIIILGIVQGITEFLPVSSFGHLRALEEVLGMQQIPGVLMEMFLHMGTTIAVIFVFFRDIKEILFSIIEIIFDLIGNLNLYIQNKHSEKKYRYTTILKGTNRHFAFMFLLSLVPSLLIGYTTRRLVSLSVESDFIVGIGFLISGIVLLVTDISKIKGDKTIKEMSYDVAIWLGICQGIAVFPGVSRFALTLSVALLLGFNKKFAIKYSLLISVPVTILGFLSQFGYFNADGMTIGIGFSYFLGMIIAALTGVFVIRFLIRLIQDMPLKFFAFYSFIAGAVLFFIGLF